ncbi:hypothetical protein L915_12240 [Phytophthora nicotianae]|uniref:Uncharacterized protein n=1 Tax=Phytophthora nicotianae TaxID=4792 RepID=W2GHE9_PHYNI|nr:hypothetical protein L915_12240 [Phytophthora nicotianae]ETL35746.1 hypothetical protein L916_12159 [Phytophthora nicotianae]ETM42224.1 hypothetical protein L914_12082 [Phytophthora nicotianae]
MHGEVNRKRSEESRLVLKVSKEEVSELEIKVPGIRSSVMDDLTVTRNPFKGSLVCRFGFSYQLCCLWKEDDDEGHGPDLEDASRTTN